MKIIKKSNIVYYVILSIIFSVYFLHLIYSIQIGNSALNLNLSFFITGKVLIGLFLISIISIFKVYKFSKYALAILFLYVSFEASKMFLYDFNKTVLVLCLIYMIFSFNIWLLWYQELNSTIYNSNFQENELFIDEFTVIKGHFLYNNEQKHFLVTNWDDGGVFIKGENFSRIRGDLALIINIDGIDFELFGKVYTNYKNIGLGIRLILENTAEDKIDQKEFYNIVKRRRLEKVI